jgi:Tol biopolymer transport system component
VSLLHAAGLVWWRRRLYMGLVMAGLLGLIGMVLSDAQSTLAGSPPAAVQPAAAGMSAVTDGQSMDGFGAWSPDGKRIAFMRDGRIWLMEATGKVFGALTTNASVWDAAPVWRPDGKQIAFSRTAMHGDAGYVMLLDPGTGKEQELVKETEPVGHVAWAPTGAGLYYTTTTRLKYVEVRSGKARLIHEIASDWEMHAGGLAVSRDGKRLVYGAGPWVGRSALYDLWLLPLGVKNPEVQRLTTGGGIMPGFDPAGKRIAYRNPRQRTGIYVMDLATHATRPLVADEPKAMYFHPAFSPDGKTMLLSRLNAPADGGDRVRLNSHLYVHTLEGSGRD